MSQVDPERISPAFLMTEVAISRHRFADILHLIAELRQLLLRVDADGGSFLDCGRLVLSTVSLRRVLVEALL